MSLIWFKKSKSEKGAWHQSKGNNKKQWLETDQFKKYRQSKCPLFEANKTRTNWYEDKKTIHRADQIIMSDTNSHVRIYLLYMLRIKLQSNSIFFSLVGYPETKCNNLTWRWKGNNVSNFIQHQIDTYLGSLTKALSPSSRNAMASFTCHIVHSTTISEY